MTTWTLPDIIAKIRNVTATTVEQLSDADVTNYVNNYFAFTMPFELKEQVDVQALNFNTFANQDVYSFPSGFLTDQPMAYANGFPLIFYQDRDIFFQDWPQQYGTDNVATGDGITVTFSGTTQAFPIISGTFLITDGTQVCSDPTGTGILTGDGTGTIDYVTGAFSVTFTAAPASSATIYDNYQAYQPARPQGVLFYNNEFTFRPIPDQVYAITLQGYINPTQLSGSASPTFGEWGQLIAYGASLDIFLDRGDLVAYSNFYPILKRYENVALARTVQQYDASQAVPRF